MNIVIRPLRAGDLAAWARMRSALWPDDLALPNIDDIADLLHEERSWAFLAEADDGTPAGFAEVTLRTCANGCDSQPVPFLEGIWVEPGFRRQAVGAGLVEHIGVFLAARGYRELGSDTEIENKESQAAHGSWGFAEIERVVCYRKLLEP
jgi:aminoglycoside 6'-N-acetyltransferase I